MGSGVGSGVAVGVGAGVGVGVFFKMLLGRKHSVGELTVETSAPSVLHFHISRNGTYSCMTQQEVTV